MAFDQKFVEFIVTHVKVSPKLAGHKLTATEVANDLVRVIAVSIYETLTSDEYIEYVQSRIKKD